MFDCCVIGLGYVGLPLSVLAADKSLDVACVDSNLDRTESLKGGQCWLEELDVRELYDRGRENGKLTFSSAIPAAKVYVVCVPTPIKLVGGESVPDVSAVLDVAKKLGESVCNDALVVIESTCPVGTTRQVAQAIIDSLHSRGMEHLSIDFAYCPERILPGNVIFELENNPRILGGLSEGSARKALDFYSQMVQGELYLATAEVAELVKLAENAFRDINIAFANELSMICDDHDVNVVEVINLANLHPRVDILAPGIGVGGHCIPVDPWFLISSSPNSALMRAARLVNSKKVDYVFSKIKERLNEIFGVSNLCADNNKPPVVTLYGLSYKQDVSDFRNSPALEIAKSLIGAFPKITFRLVDPYADGSFPAHRIENRLNIAETELLVVLVKHQKIESTLKSCEELGIPIIRAWDGIIK